MLNRDFQMLTNISGHGADARFPTGDHEASAAGWQSRDQAVVSSGRFLFENLVLSQVGHSSLSIRFPTRLIMPNSSQKGSPAAGGPATFGMSDRLEYQGAGKLVACLSNRLPVHST